MGLLNNILDKFSKAEFTVAPQKKLKSISAEFKKAFGLTLVFYKGAQIADGDLTLAALLCRWQWGGLFAGLNLVLGCFNLLPVGRLDGGRAVGCLISLLVDLTFKQQKYLVESIEKIQK